MRAVGAFISGRVTSWITLGLTVIVIGLLFATLPSSQSDSFPTSGLPGSAESAQVTSLLKAFPSSNSTVGILVFFKTTGTLSDSDVAAIGKNTAALAQLSTVPEAVRPQLSDNKSAAIVAVPLDKATVEADVATAATSLREAAATDLPSGVTARLTGPVGFQADISNAFAGADIRLLLVTVAVVAVLLIVTYRSPVLWIVPLLVVGIADGLARTVVIALADAVGLTVDASIAGILSVLVFGAGTNYALLLVARYREELLRVADRHEAMRTAVSSAGPAIAASGGTVALSLLTLLLAELSSNRALGFACAIGVTIAILFALIVLPAALVACGRGLFWPFVPRLDTAQKQRKEGSWMRLGRGVARRPVAVIIISTLAIGLLAVGLVGSSIGLSQTEQLLGTPESVVAQSIVDDAFPAGSTAQTTVLVDTDQADAAVSAAERTSGVASALAGETHNGRTAITIALDAQPQSDEAFTAIRNLRGTLADNTDTSSALVGGTDATALDTRDAAARDRGLIIPLILAIVFTILALLLRSLVAPVLLILSVLATFLASLGASNLLFQNLLGFPAYDTSVVLFSFLFLVALGVDYNIFLVTRAKEERASFGTKEGMVRALSTTGGVITSAGILLAAVFAVLGVLPVVALTQIGVIVCLGVLLDTLVVRTLLVPALVFVTGDRFWWPTRVQPASGTVRAAEEVPAAG